MSKSLFERLGGTKGIPKIANNVADTHMNKPVVNTRFIPYKEQSER